MGKGPQAADLDAEINFDLENFEDEDDILFDDEKYLSNRRDSKSAKSRQARRPRRNSSSNADMENTVVEQPPVPVDKFHVTEVKPRKQSSTSLEEVDIDSELACLVKDMRIRKDSDVVELPKNVCYYGWFFSPTASDSLRKLCEMTLKECLDVSQFQRWIEKFANQGRASEKSPRDVASYYENFNSTPLHTTAKFCGRKECVPYASEAQGHVGKEFNLAVVGFFFTEKSVGLRVKLTEEQRKLFDTERGVHQLLTRRNSTPLTSATPSAQDGKKSKGVSTGLEKKHLKDFPGLHFALQRDNFQPTDTRAHITIGTGTNIKASQAGEDLLDIIDMEQRSSTQFHDYKVPSGTLRQFGRHGDYVFVLYPKSRIYAKGVFIPVV